MSQPPRISRAYGMYALGLLTVINVVNYLERNVIFALFEPIKRDLGLSDAHLGWLGSAYVLVFSIAALPVGVLSDLKSRTTMTAFGVAVWSAFTSLGGLVRNFVQLLVCRAAVGLGGAAANAAGTALVADYFTGSMRALAMSIFTAGLALGGVLGILVAGQLEALYGWRVAFMALGLPGFGLAVMVARLRDPLHWGSFQPLRDQLRSLGVGASELVQRSLPLLLGLVLGTVAAWWADRQYGADSAVDAAVFSIVAGLGLAWNIFLWVRRARRAEAAETARMATDVRNALDELIAGFYTVVRTPTLVWVFVGGAMISFGMNGIIGWAPAFMTRELGLTVARASLLLGKWGLIFGIAGTLTGGFLADWLQRRYPWARVVVSSLGFLLGGPLAIWLLTIRDLSLFIPVFCAAFFFLTWYNGPLTSVIFDVTPQRISTTIAGAYLLFIHLAGDAIALPLVGFLSDQFGIGRAVLILPVMALLGAIVALGAVRTVRADMARVASAPA
ncbi:MAG TPA: MFS transporter [Gemmatimonadales bacterium]|nr:MFS transporter [Gemmatimonadales bacterium]